MAQAILVIVAVTLVIMAATSGRRLHAAHRRMSERRDALRERIETFANYGKLAAVRIAEARERRAELERSIDEGTRRIEAMRDEALKKKPDEPSAYYVFDRVPGRKGTVWEVLVESRDDASPWMGVRHYLVVSETAQEAKSRVRDRFPGMAGYAVSDPTPRKDF